jgi:hypothetical protein
MIFYYILSKKYSCFINDFDEFFKIFHVLFKILNDVLLHFIKKYSCSINDFDEFFKILLYLAQPIHFCKSPYLEPGLSA